MSHSMLVESTVFTILPARSMKSCGSFCLKLRAALKNEKAEAYCCM